MIFVTFSLIGLEWFYKSTNGESWLDNTNWVCIFSFSFSFLHDLFLSLDPLSLSFSLSLFLSLFFSVENL